MTLRKKLEKKTFLTKKMGHRHTKWFNVLIQNVFVRNTKKKKMTGKEKKGKRC